MKYADDIKGILNAFHPHPLKASEMAEFFYDGTMELRVGATHVSPVEDIYDACKIPGGNNTFLFLGHKGCGKSTELNKMAEELRADDYYVTTILCDTDLNLADPSFSDLLILMGEALLEIAYEVNCDLDKDIEERLKSFWTTEIEKVEADREISALSAETEAGAGFRAFWADFFARVKGELRFSSERSIEYRTKISHRASEWITIINIIAANIAEKLDGKQPIIIFEDLDKLDAKANDIEQVWKIFSLRAALLTAPDFPVIYSFPISLSYDPRFTSLEAYYTPKVLPMIKQETLDGKPFPEGTEAIRTIVKMRASLDLFDDGVLELLIEKTGGSLRDLFSAIIDSANRAIRRGSDSIAKEDAKIALVQLQTSIIRRIDRSNYPFLIDIYKGNREHIEDKKMLLEMLRGKVVLEYNFKRWHDLHPLVSDFLEETELVKT